MKEIICDLLSVGKSAKAFSLNPEVMLTHTHMFTSNILMILYKAHYKYYLKCSKQNKKVL